MDEIMINTDETTYYRVGTCHVISVFHIIENYWENIVRLWHIDIVILFYRLHDYIILIVIVTIHCHCYCHCIIPVI